MKKQVAQEAKNRFWSKVIRSGGCWKWNGTVLSSGYGIFWLKGEGVRAHRLSWEMENGTIHKGLYVCHRCDNPPCINPKHLFLGTAKENRQDAMKKGRVNVSGENNMKAALSQHDVDFIRMLYKIGYNQPSIAKRYGVTRATIGKIVRWKTWKNTTKGKGHHTPKTEAF